MHDDNKEHEDNDMCDADGDDDTEEDATDGTTMNDDVYGNRRDHHNDGLIVDQLLLPLSSFASSS